MSGGGRLRKYFMQRKGEPVTVEKACAVARWPKERFLDWLRREVRIDGGTLGPVLVPVRTQDERGEVLGAVYYCRDQRYYDAEATYRARRGVREIERVTALAQVNKALLGRTPTIACDQRALAAYVAPRAAPVFA